jgi:hypothetical protein
VTDEALEARLRDELSSFRGLWKGGFFVGDPLDPMFSPHGVFGYVGVHHAIYLACIKPYVDPQTVVAEIGPGRGAWTRTFRDAKEVWALDALSAEHNRFWEYVGPSGSIHYVQVSDFSCAELPDDGVDYLFSYDALCHVSFDGIEAYARNLYPKLRAGAHAFVMVADFEKYGAFVESRDARSVFGAFVGYFRNPVLRRLLERKAAELNRSLMARYEHFLAEPDEGAGRWYHAGVERTCQLLERIGYRVVDRDMDIDPKSPIVHFVR